MAFGMRTLTSAFKSKIREVLMHLGYVYIAGAEKRSGRLVCESLGAQSSICLICLVQSCLSLLRVAVASE